MTAAISFLNERRTGEKPVAVIDIGSNSVRLVVFDGLNRVPRVLFNEKVLCGLGRGLAETGHLHPEGFDQAMTTLSRFKALWEGIGATEVIAVATAAVRDATDGSAFCDQALRIMGSPVRILSGEEEGVYSALGVMSGMPDIDGVIGDLGGGSLEFARIYGGKVHDVISLHLGPQRLPNPHDPHDPRNVTYILEQFDKVSWKADFANRPLIAVGGAWRSIARAHMEWERYPLHFIQGYTLDQKTALDISRVIALQSPKTALKMAGVSKRRLAALPPAALVLKQVIKHMKPSEVVFSAYGLREGLVFDQLNEAQKESDPLLFACQRLGESVQRQAGFGSALATWTAPVLQSNRLDIERLRLGACALADIAWHQHPDYRQYHARDVVLRTPFAGLTHRDRAFLAGILWARYGSRLDHASFASLAEILGDDLRQQAQIIGLAIRLGVAVSGGATAVLDDVDLTCEAGHLRLALNNNPQWRGETVERRFAALADAMGIQNAEIVS